MVAAVLDRVDDQGGIRGRPLALEGAAEIPGIVDPFVGPERGPWRGRGIRLRLIHRHGSFLSSWARAPASRSSGGASDAIQRTGRGGLRPSRIRRPRRTRCQMTRAPNTAMAAIEAASRFATARLTRGRASGRSRSRRSSLRFGSVSGIVVANGLGIQGLAQLISQPVEAPIALLQVVAELEDRLDPRQVDPQVTLAAHDGPGPADLGRAVTLNPDTPHLVAQSLDE